MVDGTRPLVPYERISAEEFAAYELTVEDSTDEDCATGACPVRVDGVIRIWFWSRLRE
ncbi:hypothetical protein [Streptomyces sp. NPDC057382]|uniref:hypothetical protein n=1 Tax=unclassified Streptomyces TaxID=2593676 RepID=UPI00363DF8EA